MPWTLQQYEDNRGLRPVNEFIESLTDTDRAIVKAKLAFLLERGNQLREPFTKSLGNGLMELRAQSYRYFSAFCQVIGLFCYMPLERRAKPHQSATWHWLGNEYRRFR
jgi:hypothetical protein